MGGDAATKGMAAQLAAILDVQVQGAKGVENWSQLHGKLAEIAAATSVADPRSAVEALLGILKEANSGSDAIKVFETSIKSNPSQLKGLVLQAARQFNMIPLCDFNPVHMVDEDGNFCTQNVNRIVNSSPELSAVNAPYSVVSIVGAQSSGKSYLLNQLFGTKFPVMDGSRGRSQTSRGIMLSRCIGPSLLLLDIEGFDGREKGEDTSFEKKAALFALTVYDLMMININITDIGREQGGSTLLFRTLFQERTKLPMHLTKILVVLRRYDGETPLEMLRRDVTKNMNKIWQSVNKKSMKFKDYIEVDIIVLRDKYSSEFQQEVTEIRKLFLNNISNKVAASSFSVSSKILWDTIKQNKRLDMPTHQVAIARMHCENLIKEILNSSDSQKDYKLLKDAESPQSFQDISHEIFERSITKYNLYTEMFDPIECDKKRQEMFDQIHKVHNEYSKELILKVKTSTLEQYKHDFDRKMKNVDDGVAELYGNKIVDACIENFMGLFAELKVFESEYLQKKCVNLQKELQSYNAHRIIQIREERAARIIRNKKIKRYMIRGGLFAAHLTASLLIGDVVSPWLGLALGWY